MRLWTVHEPRNPASAEERADQTVFVKDGFSWPGLFFSVPWLLIKRLWLGLLIFILIAVAVGLAGTLLPLTENASGMLALLASLYVGLEGNDMIRRKLAKRGFVQVGSVVAKTRIEAEIEFFSAHPPQDPPARSLAQRAPHVLTARASDPGVLGLFPEPEGRR
jgi:hypothetical protein